MRKILSFRMERTSPKGVRSTIVIVEFTFTEHGGKRSGARGQQPEFALRFPFVESNRSINFTLSVQASDFQTSLSADSANTPESCVAGNKSTAAAPADSAASDGTTALNSMSTSSSLQQSGARSVQVVSFDELTHDQLMRWESIRSTRPEFATPFFSARFNGAVHSSRGDVDVALIHENDQTIGFLPFHRIGNVAYPAGRCFNDAHNIISDPYTRIDWLWLLGQIRARAFDFHAMMGEDLDDLGNQNYLGTIQSFSAELGDDSKAFLKTLGKQHKTVGRQPQKTRKMAREIGPVELEIDCRDPDLLEQTIRWKREQYQRTDILDLFTPDWTRQLLREYFDGETQTEIPGNSRGMLSVLRAGEQIVAAHYGILENGLLHYWFPAYDPTYAKYSPGTALFTAIVAEATEYGIHCIDMGYGEQPYKLKQTDQTGEVAFGCVSRSSFYRRWRNIETVAITTIKKAPMKETLKRIWRKVQPHAGISKLR